MTLRPIWKWAIAVAVLALGVFLWNREHRLRANAERETEAAQLALANQIVETQDTRRALQGNVAQLLSANAELQSAYDAARLAAPGAKPSSSSRLATGKLAVAATPRNSGPGSTDASAGPACEPCELRANDLISVQVDILELQTAKGNTIVVGTAQVWRETAPRASLALGQFRSSLSESHELQKAAPAGWGFQILGACGRAGCAPGIGVAFPPFALPLLGWRIESSLGAASGPGDPSILGSAIVRL